VSALDSVLHARLLETLDGRTLELIEQRRQKTAKRRGWLVRRALLGADVVGLTVAFAVAEYLFGHRVHADRLTLATEYMLFVALLPVWVVGAKLQGLYDRDEERADHSTADDTVGVLHLVTMGTWFLFAGAHVTGLGHPTFPKLASFWALAVVALPVSRAIARSYCRKQVNYLQNTLVIGADAVGISVARKILRHPEYGLNLVGFVDAQAVGDELPEDLEHVAVLGPAEDTLAMVQLLDVERVIIAFPDDPWPVVLDLVRTLNTFDVQVDIVPRVHEVLGPAVDVHTIEGLPLVGLRPPSLSHSSALLKRGLDVFGAAFGLLVLSPLLAVVAIAIRLDSDGPVFFQQVRVGASGELFRIMKFRTMSVDAEERKADLQHLNQHARPGGDPRMFKIDDDPRTTRVGAFLRRLDLDELPQLWNVLRGDMSLVGPRPLILDEHAYVLDWAERRLDLRPGITGLWQVLGRSTISFDEMVHLDYQYVSTWSLWNDCLILMRTLPVVVKGNGAAG
jgi:exopolysaccharide biosynthesis polyprenyl glycosylphosphotransferase